MYVMDVILSNGKRHKAYYDPEKPGVVRISKLAFQIGDSYLDGARFITGNDAAFDALTALGFTVTRPGHGKTDYSVRLPRELAGRVAAYAEASGEPEAAVIRRAVRCWVKNGCP